VVPAHFVLVDPTLYRLEGLAMARKATEYVQFKLRIREGLRRRIELEAKKKEHSANTEAVSRLERSIAEEDAAGGSEARSIILLMTAAFLSHGERAAAGQKPAKWLHDQESFRSAIFGVTRALLDSLPDSSDDEQEKTIRYIFDRVQSRKLNRDPFVEQST
jgi:hypothetical protein